MNIFKGKNFFLGSFSIEHLNEIDRRFWLTAKEVDEALGNRRYLLNVYLWCIFETINSTLVYQVANDGFNDCVELLCLCGDVYKGTKIARNKNVYYKPQFHEFYPHLKEFIDNHPECSNQDKSDKASIFLCVNGLFCKFTEYIMNKFFYQVNKNLLVCSDLAHSNSVYSYIDIIDECYENMVEIIGEKLMEKLNHAIKERFIRVSLSDIYLQSTINQYIDCLTQRDTETSKFVFRMILESMSKEE